jgi:hypothetical protein
VEDNIPTVPFPTSFLPETSEIFYSPATKLYKYHPYKNSETVNLVCSLFSDNPLASFIFTNPL